MSRRLCATLATILLTALTTGCSPQPEVPPHIERLAPDSPAVAGMPIRRPPHIPSPLREKPPFGLYAEPPSDETLASLSLGTISPDGRYRAALTQQGPWIARIDGAWLWQIRLPPPGATGPLRWSSMGTLLFRDGTGAWLEANPFTAILRPLPEELKAREIPTLPPDRPQAGGARLPGRTPHSGMDRPNR